MELQTESVGFGMDSHQGYFSSMFTSNEILPPDEASLDFLFSPHGVWSGDTMFNQNSCLTEINEPLSFTPYATPLACNIETLDTVQSTPTPIEESRHTQTAGQKRKRSSTSKATSKKQPKSDSSRRSSRQAAGETERNSASSTRAHYAVEKRYRSTLNDRYATLARLVSQPETQEICRTTCKDWEVPTKLDSSSSGKDKDSTKRQSKTTTLSVAIDTIALLDQCCTQKAKELQFMLDRLRGIVHSAPGAPTLEQYSDGLPTTIC